MSGGGEPIPKCHNTATACGMPGIYAGPGPQGREKRSCDLHFNPLTDSLVVGKETRAGRAYQLVVESPQVKLLVRADPRDVEGIDVQRFVMGMKQSGTNAEECLLIPSTGEQIRTAVQTLERHGFVKVE